MEKLLTILKHANVAMKNAKGRGRNAYIYFDEGMNNQITERIQIQSELRNAFEENEFELYYEPIVSLSNNKIVGLEALVTGIILLWDIYILMNI